ncbi:hypothetical protein B0H16DRAFT_1705394 [Mycena metata]|uniref:Uncharacterized protein n=1 Tax=Mycena metata TaxID=1033252 RepID=A0AAD7GM00_9AGAR|nr:hypothetical protein B0H16DRAFT_1705394 [Mycena metata]
MVSFTPLLLLIVSACVASTRGVAIQSLPRETGLSLRQAATCAGEGWLCNIPGWTPETCCEGLVCMFLITVYSDCLKRESIKTTDVVISCKVASPSRLNGTHWATSEGLRDTPIMPVGC